MSRTAVTRLAWGSCASIVALLTFAILFGAVNASPGAADSDGAAGLVASVVFVLAFATVGALVASRRPSNPIGWIMCASGLAYAVGGVSVSYIESFDAGGDELGGLATLALWISSWVWMAGIGPVVTLLLLLFPTGSLPSSRWKPVAVASCGGLALVVAGIAFTPGRFDDFEIENPVGIPGAEAAAAIGGVVLAGAALASLASLVFRYRRGRHDERQQLKWLTYTAGLVGLAGGFMAVVETAAGPDTTELSNTVVSGSIAAVPVAIGVAILRHGLYDIDVVINRTLVYGALTATLAAAYLAVVLLLQLALSPLTADSSLAIAGSTLAVAAFARPARRRIQQLVDRRFFRRRYDAARTLESFGARLRDEVDLAAVNGELRSVVRESMQPAHVSLWLRAPGSRT